MPDAGTQVLAEIRAGRTRYRPTKPYDDLNAVNAAIVQGAWTFDELWRAIRLKLKLRASSSDAHILKIALMKTEHLPVSRSRKQLTEEVAACRNANQFTLRLARCLIKDWLGEKEENQ